MYIFSDKQLIDTSSNTIYECQSLQTDTNGMVKILYKRVASGTFMCFYGKVATSLATGKVLFYKKSVESTTNPPKSLTECDTQTGIDGAVFKILVRAPLDGWKDKYQFDAIPDGTYLFAQKQGDGPIGCENDKTSNLTKSNNQITVSSSCVGTTNVDSYSNPFSKTLMITDSVTGPELGLGGSSDAGFVVMNTKKTNPSNKEYAYRFYIMVRVGLYEIRRTRLRAGVFLLLQELPHVSPTPPTAKTGVRALPDSQRQRVPVPVRTKATYARMRSTDAFLTPARTKERANEMVHGTTANAGQDSPERIATDKCLNTPCQNNGNCLTYRDANIDACLMKPCSNGGTCLSKSLSTSQNDFKCVCPLGTYGNKCEMTGQGPCAGDPCLNGGTCEAVGGSFKCRCASGYSGNTCQVAMGCSSTPCKNDGSCIETGDGFYCECTSYYSGMYCDEYEDWFIILLVLVILALIIFFILITICACYCCCGWRPGSNKTPYESYVDQQNGASVYGGDRTAYMSSYGMPADPAPETVQFNFVPLSPYQGIATTN
ncbi:hypothetical protein LSH36_591g01144 [Paralvinella palmiformis]|uniref:EGF-like domain-containing protein n=1 Tax=Paralvinella palmiformis TaxID=53620 RepID=A0AAD9J591_9ANNE|nr:hypothetical protein LSH36_591g01144 [Paralvinella palmiformis]